MSSNGGMRSGRLTIGPKDLWAHQADVLRDYLAHVDDADLAIELPTGAGKTLVGMLASQLQPAPS